MKGASQHDVADVSRARDRMLVSVKDGMLLEIFGIIWRVRVERVRAAGPYYAARPARAPLTRYYPHARTPRLQAHLTRKVLPT